MTAYLGVHVQGRGMVAGLHPEAFQYPGGEWSLRGFEGLQEDLGEGNRGHVITLTADIRGADPNDLIKAALWADVARRGNFHSNTRIDPQFALMIPYVPAGRADRGAPMGVSTYARLFRSLNADRILTIDPHSVQTNHSYALSSMRVVEHDSMIAEAFDGIRIDGVIAPDAGAHCRAESAALFLGGKDVYYASKKRDFETGKLSSFTAPENLSKSGTYLVVDDICDGGGTFIGLAGALDLNRNQLALWVTHGIFSGKADQLRTAYRWIATTDSHPGSGRVGVATCIVPCFPNMIQYI